MAKWQGELAEVRGMLANVEKNVRPKPWKKKYEFCNSDVGQASHGIGRWSLSYTLNIMPRLQNQIRSMQHLIIQNFTKINGWDILNYYNFSVVYLGKDINGYIRIPRGLRENIIQECKTAAFQ